MVTNPFVALREAALRTLGDFKVYDDLMAESHKLSTKPDAKVRVIGAGLPRTGTLSMYAAMHILGYQVSHTLVTFWPACCHRVEHRALPAPPPIKCVPARYHSATMA